MLSTLTRVINYSFRSPKILKKQIDLQKIKAQRKALMDQLPHFYTTSSREHEDNVYQEKLYGRKCYIIGMTPDSEQSATYFKSVFKQLSPGLVILGGFNNSKLFTLRLTNSLEQKRSIRGYDSAIQPSKLFCKKLITPMVTKILAQSKDYSVNEQNQVVYHIDHTNKHIQSSNYLTILNRAMFKQFTKLSFGLPSDYILFEDIMIQQSIQSLRQMHSKIINTVKLNRNKYGQSERTGRFYPDHIREQMKFYGLNEPALNKKQISYTSALLNKTVTSIDKVVLFVANQHVHQIAQNVHKISINPQQVYRAGFNNNIDEYIKSSSNSQTGIKLFKYLYNDNKSEAIDELIEKFVILNDLKHNALQIELLENNQNVFTKMVFRSLFADLTVEDIIVRYQNRRNQYNLKIGQVIQKRVLDVVHYKQTQKNFYTLTEMLKTQEQRIEDFPIKLQIDNKQTRRQNKRDLMEIYQQIKQISRNQLEPNQKQLITAYLSGKITKQNLILFQKLFVKAKIKLKKTNIKLPVHHFGALSAVFKDQIKQYMVGGAQKVKLQNFKQSIEELKQSGLFKQITEQEFEKLQSSNFPRFSIQLDENGAGNIIPDGQTVEQFQKTAGEDVLKDFLEMQNVLKDKDHHYQQYDEEDEGKQKKSTPKKDRKGRRIN